MAKVRLTAEGKARLSEELESLIHVRRQELADRIRQAREEAHGDSGDSTAYEDAKADLALLEQRIQELERTLAEVELVPESAAGRSEIGIGCHVMVKDEGGEEEEYVIVDHAEADPRRGRISHESPVGAALLGHRSGDVIEVRTPAGVRRLTVGEIR